MANRSAADSLEASNMVRIRASYVDTAEYFRIIIPLHYCMQTQWNSTASEGQKKQQQKEEAGADRAGFVRSGQPRRSGRGAVLNFGRAEYGEAVKTYPVEEIDCRWIANLDVSSTADVFTSVGMMRGQGIIRVVVLVVVVVVVATLF